MDDLLTRAWKYYRRNGWQRSMKMLRRKLEGTARVSRGNYVREFNVIGGGATAREGALDSLGAETAKVLPRGIVAIIGDLNLPQCKKYRVIQKLETLNSMGLEADYSFWGDVPRSLNILQIASCVIFYRMPDNDQFHSYLAEARRLGIPAGYDIDDPIFDKPVYGSNPNLEFLTAGERASLLSATESYRRAMSSSDFVITSTPAMKALASQSARHVYMWRNAVDAETRHWAEVAAKLPLKRDGDGVVLGYSSGSRAHEADFRTIEGVLAEVFMRFENVTLRVNGYLELPDSLTAYSGRIVTAPFASYGDYLANMRQVDINLVPLVADRFNDCKSAIRFLDAAVVGVPTIAARIGDFVNVVEENRTGVLAGSEEEWTERLAWLIQNPQERRRLGLAARQSALTASSAAATGQGLDPELASRLREFAP